MSLNQQEEERVLVEAVACAERRSYAVNMAAVVKSLTSAEKPTLAEIAEQRGAEAEWQKASKALADYEDRRLQ
jgi:hypothetical protein